MGWYNAVLRDTMLSLSAPILISRLVVLIVAFTFHELGHALTAHIFGDRTPESDGRLSLNPLKHIDPVGALLLLFTGFGWAKPVMVNKYVLERRSSAAPMLVALMGPLSNFLLAVIAAIPLRLGFVQYSNPSGNFFPTAYQFVNEFIFINLLLMLFNLLPIAPLDGEKVLIHFLPYEGQEFLLRLRPYGPMILMALIFLAPLVGIDILGIVIGIPITYLYRLLIG